jgi:signal transduction histidine kinase
LTRVGARALGLPLAMLAGGAVGAESISLAHRQPAYSLAGAGALAAAAELAAGGGLLAAAATILVRRPGNRAGPLLVAAAWAWFLVEWNNPGAGTSLVFSIGLALGTACPALVAHAALAYPRGRLDGMLDRVAVGLGYLAALTSGVAQAAVFDPPAESCAQCPRNLLLVHGSHGAYVRFNQWGVGTGLAAAAVLALLCLRRISSAGPVLRRFAAPVLAPAAAYLALVGWDDAHGLRRGFLSNDRLDHRLWLAESAVLCALSLGVVVDVLLGHLTRTRLARLVVALDDAPAVGALARSLADLLGDPALSLAYPLSDGRLVDASGRAVQRGPHLTPIIRGGETVALLGHRPGLLDDQTLAGHIAGAARLSFDNERLGAEIRARLEDLRASRARIVAAGDRERQRLERDLHDGAQQRLLSLALALRMLRSRRPDQADRLADAEAELGLALSDLRELAHGIYPAVLADEGIAAALEELGDRAPVPLTLSAMPEQRLPSAAEAATYFAVAEALRTASDGIAVGVRPAGAVLRVEIDGVSPEVDLVAIRDRVGALGGHVEAMPVRIVIEIPCE